MTGRQRPHSAQSLRTDLAALGLRQGDAVLVHAALRKVGRILGGPDALILALRRAIGREGTLLAYADWQAEEDWFDDPELRDLVPPFDLLSSRATRDNGAFPELLRTTPGALRSANPGASCVAIGGRAEWFVAGHALDYGYGAQSPFGKLVAAGGRTLLIGAPWDTMTLLHHAEHLANIPGKRIRRYEAPVLVENATVWQTFEEFNTSDPVVDGLPDDYFAQVVRDFRATGRGHEGRIGDAPALLADAAEIVPFAVNWLESRFRRPQ